MTISAERFGLGVSNHRSVDHVVSAVRMAEERRAEMAFIAEDVGCRDAFELCALAAGETKCIRLATGIVNPYTRSPISLAMATATLDELSGGRATLGLGTGSPEVLEERMGIPRGRPVRVMQEATDIIKDLLSGQNVTYEGQVFKYSNARLEVRAVQPHVPIFLAAMGPQMLRLAGKIADGVLLNVGASVEYVRWAVGQIETAAKQAGRSLEDVTIAAWLSVYVTHDYEAGVQRAREFLARCLAVPKQGELRLQHSHVDPSILPRIRSLVQSYPHSGDARAAGEHVPPQVAERLALIGTADQVHARVQEYRAAGVDLPIFNPGAFGALFAT